MGEPSRIKTYADCAEAHWNLWRLGLSGGFVMGG